MGVYEALSHPQFLTDELYLDLMVRMEAIWRLYVRDHYEAARILIDDRLRQTENLPRLIEIQGIKIKFMERRLAEARAFLTMMEESLELNQYEVLDSS